MTLNQDGDDVALEATNHIFLTETAHYADVVLPASAFPEKSGTFTDTDRRRAGRRSRIV